MAYRSARMDISDWREKYKAGLTSEKPEAVLSIGQMYAVYVNHDRSRNKTIRRKILLIVAGTVAVILCLIGVTKYRLNYVNIKLGDNVYEFKGIKYTLQEDGTARIDGYIGTVPAELVLPAELHGAPVTSIGKDAFAGKQRIVQINQYL